MTVDGGNLLEEKSLKKIGFIGVGNMGSAVARVFATKNEEYFIYMTNRTLEKAQQLAKEVGGVVTDLETIVARCDVIFLGVKPQGMEALLQEMTPFLKARCGEISLVSMAAGLTTEKLQRWSGGYAYEVIRIMPNLPLVAGSGVVLYCGTQEQSATLALLQKQFSQFGLADEIPESLMDAGSAISGCGPAFCALFVEALADGGVRCGLPREKAVAYAIQTLIGTGDYLKQLDKHPAVVKDEVCSPSGSTIRGVEKLEECGLRHAVLQGVVAAYERTEALGKS